MQSEPPPTREQTSVVSDQGVTPGSAVLIEINKHVIYKLDKPLVTLGDSENDDVFVSGFLVDEGHVVIERSEGELWIRSQKLLGQFNATLGGFTWSQFTDALDCLGPTLATFRRAQRIRRGHTFLPVGIASPLFCCRLVNNFLAHFLTFTVTTIPLHFGQPAALCRLVHFHS